MKIVLLDRATLGTDCNLSPLERFGELMVYDRTLPEETVCRTSDADIVITNKVIIDKAVMDRARLLKLICIAATGMNNVDVDYARIRGIAVKNVVGYSTESVVQMTFSHVLSLLCQHRYYDNFAKTNWYASPIFTHIGPPFYELAGKQWGVIGLGTIGRRVAEVARAFGCRVVYYSTSGLNTTTDFQRLGLDELIATSHIVTIHAPLNERTKDLIDYTKLQLLQNGAILVNMGRGGIVHEADLARVLDERQVYAGLDVVAQEPIAADNPLLHITHTERLSLTPHIAWTSIEARHRLIEGIADNIGTFLSSSSGDK